MTALIVTLNNLLNFLPVQQIALTGQLLLCDSSFNHPKMFA
jgi:hypothetical protein